MTTNSSIVRPSELRRARAAIGAELEDAAQAVDVDPHALRAWEEGRESPDLVSLERLADFYGRGVDYFLRDRPSTPSSVFLRTSSHVPASHLSPAKRRSLVEFEELCRAEWELEQTLQQPNAVRLSPQPQIGDPEDLAEGERERIGLDSQPVPNLRETLGRQGVRVYELPLSEDMAGLSWWHHTYGPSILVSLSDPAGRRNFTMAHEYGHLASGSQSGEPILCEQQDLPDSDVEAERFADRFAAAFLMPRRDVSAQWSQALQKTEEIDARLIQRLSQRYQVSTEALAIRLEELGLLPNARWVIQTLGKIRTFGKRRPDWRRVRGERFLKKALSAYASEKISLGKLAQILGTDIRTARSQSQESSSNT